MSQTLKKSASQKTLVVTGASRGIGRATAQRFQQAGYRVVNLSRSEPPLSNIHHLTVDLSDPAAIDGMRDTLQQQVAGSSQIVLIHNAGLLRKDTIADLAYQSLQQVLQVNVVAPSQLNAMLIPQMQTGSSILYVGSTLSEKGVPNTCSYVTAKHAVLGLMRATCQDLVGTGIHTACICPGFTETEMLKAHVGGSQEVLQAIADSNAYKRLAEPEELADTLLFAAQNPVINGAVMHANLGQIEA